jgi:hypothetical protein
MITADRHNKREERQRGDKPRKGSAGRETERGARGANKKKEDMLYAQRLQFNGVKVLSL